MKKYNIEQLYKFNKHYYIYKINSLKNENVKVLDFGAGTGNLTNHFLDKGFNIFSLDVSKESLALIKKKHKGKNNLKLIHFDGQKIPLEKETFDLVGTYSVLHHIPDYLKAVKSMISLVKKGGYIYIDHETNEFKWNPTEELKEWYLLIKKPFYKNLFKIILTGEFFSIARWKGFFIRKFINKRFKTEGDIHVWQDDHIEWEKIINLLNANGFEIMKEKDYLMYDDEIKKELYDKYSQKCTDTKLIIAKKIK